MLRVSLFLVGICGDAFCDEAGGDVRAHDDGDVGFHGGVDHDRGAGAGDVHVAAGVSPDRGIDLEVREVDQRGDGVLERCSGEFVVRLRQQWRYSENIRLEMWSLPEGGGGGASGPIREILSYEVWPPPGCRCRHTRDRSRTSRKKE